jgi:FHS family L-fucose permease-like MFS transporter
MSENKKVSVAYQITIIGILFFIFGFVTWANSTLIPYLKIACELKSNAQSLLVTFAFFIAYFVMAIPSSIILKKSGYKNGMSIGLLTMAVGAILFIPAAKTRNFNLFLIGLFIIATGLALLQTASNPFVTVLGPINSAAKRISIMGICNKVGGILAGIVLGAIALKDVDTLNSKLLTLDEISRNNELNALAARVIIPYTLVAIGFVILAIGIYFTKLPDIQDEEIVDSSSTNDKSIFTFPHLWLGVIALFLYVGVEVLSYDTIIGLGNSLGVPLAKAKYFASFTGTFMLVGYVIGILTIPKIISQEKALIISAIAGLVLTILLLVTRNTVPVIALASLGLANALMWPAIWPLAIDGLGKHIKLGSAFLIMAIAGGAVIPFIYGKLFDFESIGAQKAYFIMIPCYLFILYYAMAGHKVGREKV